MSARRSPQGARSPLTIVIGCDTFGPNVNGAAKFAERRSQDDISGSRLRYELFYSFFLPQFEGLDNVMAAQLVGTMDSVLDAPEQSEVRRVVAELQADANSSR